MQISIIAAIDQENGLGKDNQLLCHMPADLKHFKSVTMGKPIVMGYNTFVSIGKALPGRINIVLSRQMRQLPANVMLCHSLEQALQACASAEDIMIIGGADLYRQSLPIANRLYITKIEHTFDADVFFPYIDKQRWQQERVAAYEPDEKNSYPYAFYTYVKKELI